MNINKRERLLALVAIGALVLYAVLQLVLTPLANSWKARSERIVKLKKDVRDGMVPVKRETSIRAQWGNMRTNTFASTKPDAESQMLKAFERWSQEGHISVSSIRWQWKETEDDYRLLECRADAGGDLSALTRFLYEIERDPLGVRVDAMELTARDSSGQQMALAFQISGLQLLPPKR